MSDGYTVGFCFKGGANLSGHKVFTKVESTMNFHTVFDTSDVSPPILIPCLGLIFNAVLVFIAFNKDMPWNKPEDGILLFRRRGFLRAVFTVGLIGNVVVVAWIGLKYILVERDIANNNYKIVDGIVTNFHPLPVSGHGVESFEVDLVHFSYSDYILSSGFSTTSRRGGPIREGLHVRISYIGNTIIKLEVAQ